MAYLTGPERDPNLQPSRWELFLLIVQMFRYKGEDILMDGIDWALRRKPPSILPSSPLMSAVWRSKFDPKVVKEKMVTLSLLRFLSRELIAHHKNNAQARRSNLACKS
jgi:hypothetical protein